MKNERATQPNLRPNLWPIWLAICATPLVFAGLTTVIPPASPPDPQLTAILGLASVGPAVMSLLWGRLVARHILSPTVWILRWASGEAVSVMGLASWLLGGLLVPSVCMLAVGFVLVAVQFPRGASE